MNGGNTVGDMENFIKKAWGMLISPLMLYIVAIVLLVIALIEYTRPSVSYVLGFGVLAFVIAVWWGYSNIEHIAKKIPQAAVGGYYDL